MIFIQVLSNPLNCNKICLSSMERSLRILERFSSFTLIISCSEFVIFYPLDNFLEVIKKSNETPVKKFKFPQTSAQEIGWNTEPLVSFLTFFLTLFVELHKLVNKSQLKGVVVCFQIDRLWKDRLDHPIVNAEITKFMDKKWMVKEQTEINQS